MVMQDAGSEGPSGQATQERHIPVTVSAPWHEELMSYPDPSSIPTFPLPGDSQGWRDIQNIMELEALEVSNKAVQCYSPDVNARTLNGVPVLEITPSGWRDDGSVIVYTHGGAYVLYSARSTLHSSALMAHRTGRKVIAVDYTLAPHARWRTITDQVVSVLTGLELEGVGHKNIAIYGDSAGGSLAVGSVLKMRDQGHSLPAAIVMWSPWSDITETGDTYFTLKDAELSYTYAQHLRFAANAYADEEDQKNPYVSPAYGDYSSGGFPPVLIQGGTRELFLSNFVRHYQALDQAGQIVKLDLYEGMPHVFQAVLPESLESIRALKKVDTFLEMFIGK